MSKYLKLFLIVFCLSSYKFFRPIFLSDELLKFIYYLLLIIVIGISIRYSFFYKKRGFGLLINLLIIAVLISVFSCYLFWKQNILYTLLASLPLFSFFVYPFIKYYRLKPKDLEYICWVFTILFALCFIGAYAVAPTKIFTGYGELEKGLDTSRGIARIRLTTIGGGALYFCYFLSINKYINKRSFKALCIALFLFALIVLQLGRQAIIISLILTVVMILREVSVLKKMLIISFLYIATTLIINNVTVIKNLVEITEEQVESNNEDESDIRILSYKFYMLDFPGTIQTTLFGHGMYSLKEGSGDYGDYINKYGRDYGLIPADVGYAFIYLIFGALGLILMGFILRRVFFIKVFKEYEYARYYVFFLFLTSVAGNSILSNIPLLCFSLYILEHQNKSRFKHLYFEKN